MIKLFPSLKSISIELNGFIRRIKHCMPCFTAHIAPPGDFIALGKHSKPGSSDGDSTKVPTPKKLGVPSGKREASGASGLAKKPKLMGQTFTPLGRSDVERRSSPAPTPASLSQYEELAIDGLYECYKRIDFKFLQMFLISFC